MTIIRKRRAQLEICDDVVVKTYHHHKQADRELWWYQSPIGRLFAPPLLDHQPGILVIARGRPVDAPMPHELYSILSALEKQHIHHRDIWPGNLTIIKGKLKLIDWETATIANNPSYDLHGPHTSNVPIPAIHRALHSHYSMWWNAQHPQSIASLWGVRVSDVAA